MIYSVFLVSLFILNCASSVQVIHGSGTSTVGLLFDAVATVYTQTENPNVQLEYTETDSTSGMNSIIEGFSVFAGSDIPLTDEQYDLVPDIQTLPLITVGLVPYTSSFSGLILTRELIADIFMGKISQWNNPEIEALNPKISFPESTITVIYREGSSGETSIFTKALCVFSEEFASLYGTFDTWPEELTSLDNFLSAQGESGEFTTSNLTPFSISYVTFGFVHRHSAEEFTVGILNESDGRIVKCNVETIGLAATDADFDERFTADISILKDPEAWPISSFSYLVLRKSSTPVGRCDEFTEVARYLLYESTSYTTQILLSDNGYAPIPEDTAILYRQMIGDLICDGKQVIDINNYRLPVPEVTLPYYLSMEYSVYSPIPSATYAPFYDSIGQPISSQDPSRKLSSLILVEETTEYLYQVFYGGDELSSPISSSHVLLTSLWTCTVVTLFLL